MLAFAGKAKKMVLNKTNMQIIAAHTKSRETDDWVGWQVTLVEGKTQWQGNMVPALRVSDEPASASPPFERRTDGRVDDGVH